MKLLKINFLLKILIVSFWVMIVFLFLFSPIFKTNKSNKFINVLTWGSLIDSSNISKFEKETGIKVNLNFYETNDELISKINVTCGKDYDLITINDNVLKYCKKNNMLKKIDKSKITVFNEIDPHLFGHKFDPNFDYSLPLYWDIFGIGINKKFFNGKMPEPSWKLIFDKNYYKGKVAMVDDSNNAILITAQYLFGTIKNLDQNKLNLIKNTLIKQKKIVESYTDYRADFCLKAGLCSAAASLSEYIYRVLSKNSNLAFLIPKEGSFLVVDLMTIPKSCQKEKYVYEFINFLYKDEIVKKHYELFGYLPVKSKVLNSLDLSYIGNLKDLFSDEKFSKFEFFDTDVPLTKINEIWTEVKA